MKKRLLFILTALTLCLAVHTHPVLAATDEPDDTPPDSATSVTSDEVDQAALERAIQKNQEQSVAGSTAQALKSLFTSGGYKVDSAAANLPARVGRIVNIVFAISGTIFLAIVVYSGIRWMVAGDNADTIKQSKKRVTRASVGLLILLSSWIITNFILRGILLGPAATPSFNQPGGSFNQGGSFQIDRYPR